MKLFSPSTTSLLLLLLQSFLSSAQDKVHDKNSEHTNKHSIALMLSHTQINEGVNEQGKRQWLSLPSWGINYTYFIDGKWAVGLHSDIIIEDFVVESIGRSSQETIERSYPIATALVGLYKPTKHFSILAGSGMEITKEQNFFLVRFGLEYSYHFHDNWELIANLVNDLKVNGYNSFGIGLGVAHHF
ncbi:hypothetical protein [Winogradskyella sp. 3972H.M.0a.05]|uniref:hypothetical protein n=1 Tax=Winogradskyella sp. 3972H.M.0a.05 TaxID=2950277 RepID=UPI00339ADFFE